MALSDADLRGIAAHQEPRVLLHHEVVKFARAIEAEVRKQDEALILQLVEALEDFDDAGPPGEGWKSAPLLSLLASARARLASTPATSGTAPELAALSIDGQRLN